MLPVQSSVRIILLVIDVGQVAAYTGGNVVDNPVINTAAVRIIVSFIEKVVL